MIRLLTQCCTRLFPQAFQPQTVLFNSDYTEEIIIVRTPILEENDEDDWDDWDDDDDDDDD